MFMGFLRDEENLIYLMMLDQPLQEIKKEYGDKGFSDFLMLATSHMTKDDWDTTQDLQLKIGGIYWRRQYELDRLIYKPETIEKWYKKIPAVIDEKDIPPKLLQIGLYLKYNAHLLEKVEGEEEDDFQRRKDAYDFLFGYVNKELISDSLFKLKELNEERNRQHERLQNFYNVFHNNMGK